MTFPIDGKNEIHVPVTTDQISYKIPLNRHFPMVFQSPPTSSPSKRMGDPLKRRIVLLEFGHISWGMNQQAGDLGFNGELESYQVE